MYTIKSSLVATSLKL